jgi:hypothetical protein
MALYNTIDLTTINASTEETVRSDNLIYHPRTFADLAVAAKIVILYIGKLFF